MQKMVLIYREYATTAGSRVRALRPGMRIDARRYFRHAAVVVLM